MQKINRTTQLLIDFDHKFIVHRMLFERSLRQKLNLIANLCGIAWTEVTIVETNHGYHYTVTLDFPVHYTIALNLQTLLGDDSMRCIFNLNRLLLGWSWKNSNLFFEENEKKLKGVWFNG